MASDQDPTPSPFDGLPPLFLGFSARPGEDPQNGERIVRVGMVMLGTDGRFEDVLSRLSEKQGARPASKAAVEAMPRVAVREQDKEKECPICLEGWEVGAEAREMPCKHRYHSGCIEKWLGVRESCPLCRFKMPVEEEEEEGSDDEVEESVDVVISVVSFRVGRRGSRGAQRPSAAADANPNGSES